MAIQLNHRTDTITTGATAETAGVTLVINNTGSLTLPKGTTGQQPAGAVAGDFRYNTTDNTLEYFDGSNWATVLSNYVSDLRDEATAQYIIDGVDAAGAGSANYIQVTNADDGSAPSIAAVGNTDTDVNLDLVAKGEGDVVISDGNGAIATFTSGGPNTLEFKAGSVAAEISSPGDMNINGDVVHILNDGNEVARFQGTGGGNDEYLVVESFVSGVRLSVESGGQPGGELHINQILKMSGNRIADVADPTQQQDAATKAYVDAAIAGLDWKASVEVATVAASASDYTSWVYVSANDDNTTATPVVWDLPTSALTLDGVTVQDGFRVLVKDTAEPKGHGLFTYNAADNTLLRAADADNSPGNEVSNELAVFVESGTVNANTGWTVTSPAGNATLGTDDIEFTQFSGPGSTIVTGGNGIETTQSGNEWTVDALTDDVTVYVNGGDNLAVRSTGTAGQVLRSSGTDGTDAVWGALDLANADAVTGVLPEANGGTGESTFVNGDVLVGDGTGLTKLAVGTEGQFLRSDGTTLVYASASLQDLDGFAVTGAVAGEALVFDGTDWTNSALDLSNGAAVTGTLDVDHGGTGLSTVAQGSLVYGIGGSALATLPIGTSSSSDLAYVLKTAEDGTEPEWGTLSVAALSDVSAASPSSGDVLVFDGDDWVPQAGADTDKFVRITGNDTTSGYLNDKVVVQGALSANVLNASGDEDLQLSVKVDDTTIFENADELAVKSSNTAGQVLVSDGAGGVATWGALDLANEDAITGVLDTQAGGTGLASVADQSLLLGSGASALNTLAVGGNGTFLRVSAGSVLWDNMVLADISDLSIGAATSGQVLAFNSAAGTWEASNVDLASDIIDGVLPVEHGGTGVASVTAGSLLLGDGTNALTELAPGTPSDSDTATVLLTDASGDISFGNISLNQLSDVSTSGASNTDVLQFSGGEWVASPLGALDKLVRVSNNDTTSGFLAEKLVGATDGAVTFAQANDGADEDYELSVNVDTNTIIKVGNNLSVGDDTDRTDQILKGGLANAAATWGYLSTLRDITSGEEIVTAGGTVTNGNNLAVNVTDGDTTLSSNEDMLITSTSGNVSIQGTTYPNTVNARSVLVANGAGALTTVQASAGDFQILRWNNTGGSFEFVSQDDVGGFSFSEFVTSGNGNNATASATQTLDTLTLTGGQGIAIDAGAKTLTFEQTTSGVTTQAPVTSDTIQFFSGGSLVQTDMAAFLSALDVPSVPSGSGLVVQTSAGEFANREVVASTANDALGISVVDTAASAGNVTVGLDINGLTELAGTADTNADMVVLYDDSAGTNVKVSVSALVGGIDNTRINDTADTTYVDTDEVAGTVVVAASGEVARFVNGEGTADYFNFDAGTSAGTLRLEAVGTSTDIDIRLVPEGNGQVFIGDTGDGVIQSDDEFDLTVKGGNSTTANAGGDMLVEGGDSTSTGDGGNTIIRGGSSTGGTAGTTQITDADGNEFVTFGNDSSIEVSNVSDASSFTKDYIVTLETTGTGSDTADIALDSDTTAFFEVAYIARDASNNDWNGAIRVKGAAYNDGGTVSLVDGYTIQEVISIDTNLTGLDATVTTNAGNVRLSVTGANASSNLKWTAFVKMVAVTN